MAAASSLRDSQRSGRGGRPHSDSQVESAQRQPRDRLRDVAVKRIMSNVMQRSGQQQKRTQEEGKPGLIGYVRVSTEDQAREGVSLQAQRERLAAYATAHGWELAGIEADEGISGAVAPGKRPGLARALGRVRRGEADGLLVLKLDRLSRSTRDVLDLADDANRGQWRLVSVSEHLDTGTATGEFTLTILAALAQLERKQIGERTRVALGSIAREGRARSRFVPFGYRTHDGSTEVVRGDRRPIRKDPHEQRTLRRILAMRADGLGARRIAGHLNASSTISRTGRPWSRGTVESILRSHQARTRALA